MEFSVEQRAPGGVKVKTIVAPGEASALKRTIKLIDDGAYKVIVKALNDGGAQPAWRMKKGMTHPQYHPDYDSPLQAQAKAEKVAAKAEKMKAAFAGGFAVVIPVTVQATSEQTQQAIAEIAGGKTFAQWAKSFLEDGIGDDLDNLKDDLDDLDDFEVSVGEPVTQAPDTITLDPATPVVPASVAANDWGE